MTVATRNSCSRRRSPGVAAISAFDRKSRRVRERRPVRRRETTDIAEVRATPRARRDARCAARGRPCIDRTLSTSRAHVVRLNVGPRSDEEPATHAATSLRPAQAARCVMPWSPTAPTSSPRPANSSASRGARRAPSARNRGTTCSRSRAAAPSRRRRSAGSRRPPPTPASPRDASHGPTWSTAPWSCRAAAPRAATRTRRCRTGAGTTAAPRRSPPPRCRRPDGCRRWWCGACGAACCRARRRAPRSRGRLPPLPWRRRDRDAVMSPSMKNVARHPSASSSSRNSGVDAASGPSSNVSAT